jgi:hypothetical protein
MDSVSRHLNQKLFERARQLAGLTRILRACLPENCRSHVAVAGIRDNQLILMTDSPVWVSRLRMYSQDMLAMLQQHSGLSLSQIRIKQSPPGSIAKPEPVKKSRHLSEHSSAMIAQTAQGITDPDLQQALLNLAKNTRKKKD